MQQQAFDYDYYLIVDLEATCCNQQTIKRHEMEIIEIGAVMVEAKNLTVVDEFQCFIKPVRHPTLTPFCTELTSITQQQVNHALNYAEAITAFKTWHLAYKNSLFCSWGDYDRKQFIQDSNFHRVPYPFSSPHENIKIRFSTNQGLKKRFGMDGALKKAGLTLNGTHHRGIDDARNMARLMPYIVGEAKIGKN